MKARATDVFLLDANLLVALADSAHVHHEAAVRAFKLSGALFATCPITQAALLRVMLRLGTVPSMASALQVLEGFTSHPRHRFWPADLPCGQIEWRGVAGQRQVTDAYLAALARHHGGKLASLDQGLVALHADVAVLVPT